MRVLNEFSIGDEVVVRAWADMAGEFGLDSDGDVRTRPVFVGMMASFCGRKARIVGIDGNILLLRFEDKGADEYAQRWVFSADMVERYEAHEELVIDDVTKLLFG